ncbi:hypothetical protein [Dysosmobacter sp.]|uniref:hypothetical protein n=1 Tax=Dysosmobacter sp. TaxID=2591382 RepID=UPI002A96D0FB|nr:hypothetical protein [Dysosmobacter sp.]MDY5510005.1 hypothetical protein [Dysosmobacter sp.]
MPKTTANETQNTESLEQAPIQDTQQAPIQDTQQAPAQDTAQKDPATQDAKQVEKVRRGDELVEVELFYDGDKYKDPVPVIVNGIKIEVPRGKSVKIKRKYAEVLEHSMAQDKRAGQMQARMAAEFAQETRDLGLETE